MDRFRYFVREHQWTVLLVAFGIVLSILLMTIGFFRTLLLAVIVGACFYVGNKIDRNGKGSVKDSFENFFRKKDEGDR